jgi:hypothetical protein
VTAPPPAGARSRPADVDTGFWLWMAALSLLLVGQIVDVVTTATAADAAKAAGSKYLGILGIAFILAVGAVVVTLLVLMRSGYRWARSLLTGGGLATIFYTLASLLGAAREPTGAVVFAVTGIIGSVLIGGGTYLLHRPDSQGFFTR